MSPNIEAVANPLAAACEDGYVPDEFYVLESPGLSDSLDRFTSMMERVVVEYGGATPTFSITKLDHETDFEHIVEHYRDPIVQAHEAGGSAAVDVTPGRKFMSAIAFQAGIQYEADYVFYLYLSEGQFYGRIYPDVPNRAVDLIDFGGIF